MKVDLCMWVKDGARTLPVVLDRINRVVPVGVVNQRLVVDDGSTDSSRDIAVSLGWRVVSNRGRGISDGANTALSYVETDLFCSFEQDVLVSPLWFSRVSRLMDRGAAAACGLRFLPKNSFCYNIDSYMLSHNSGDYGKTLDNTFWDAEVLRSISGFPKVTNAFAETILHNELRRLGYRWLVDYGVRSLHLHGGLCDELRHYRFYGANLVELNRHLGWRGDVWGKVVRSPVAALRMAFSTGDPRLFVSYPLCRLAMLGGYLRGCA
ncbi:MAG: glycosyltransferase [Candidatus Paceibacterota bacterium]